MPRLVCDCGTWDRIHEPGCGGWRPFSQYEDDDDPYEFHEDEF